MDYFEIISPYHWSMGSTSSTKYHGRRKCCVVCGRGIDHGRATIVMRSRDELRPLIEEIWDFFKDPDSRKEIDKELEIDNLTRMKA